LKVTVNGAEVASNYPTDIDPVTKQPISLDSKTTICGANIYTSDTNTIGNYLINYLHFSKYEQL